MAREVASDALLSVVAPVYNEIDNIEPFVKEVRDSLERLDVPKRHEIVLVNDGSTDGSAEKLDEIAAEHKDAIQVVHLARNFGHAAAVCAGLDHASGDAVILMDSDMQDDPQAFALFVQKWREGHDVVYALRTSRHESILSRLLFWLFYRSLRWVAHIEIPRNAGNFALMDRRALKVLNSLPERNRYLPGLRAYIGLHQAGVPVPRRARYDKMPRVGLSGLWKLAMNAYFSFSYVPLSVFRILGLANIALSMLLILYAMYHKLVTGLAVKMWASLFIPVCFFGGVNILAIGIIGEYVARIYDEVKQRPIYIVDRITKHG